MWGEAGLWGKVEFSILTELDGKQNYFPSKKLKMPAIHVTGTPLIRCPHPPFNVMQGKDAARTSCGSAIVANVSSWSSTSGHAIGDNFDDANCRMWPPQQRGHWSRAPEQDAEGSDGSWNPHPLNPTERPCQLSSTTSPV